MAVIKLVLSHHAIQIYQDGEHGEENMGEIQEWGFGHVMLERQETLCGGTYLCNFSPWEVKEGGLEVQDHPGLHSDFQASLSYMQRCPADKMAH